MAFQVLPNRSWFLAQHIQASIDTTYIEKLCHVSPILCMDNKKVAIIKKTVGYQSLSSVVEMLMRSTAVSACHKKVKIFPP